MTQLDEHGMRILSFVAGYQRQYHRSPSYREIGAALGLASSDHVARDLKRLRQLGYLDYTPGVTRSIVLNKRLAARHPTASPSPSQGTLNAAVSCQEKANHLSPEELSLLTSSLCESEDDLHILHLDAASLREAQLEDGDLVLVKRTEDVKDGELAAVRLQKQARVLLRYVYREGARLRLQPLFSNQVPQYVSKEQVVSQESVVAIIRRPRD